MGCVASRPNVLGDHAADEAHPLRSISKQQARRQRSKKAAAYTVKDVSTRSADSAAGTGTLLQPFGSGTNQSVQSFTIAAAGSGRRSLEGGIPAPPLRAAPSGAESLGSVFSNASSLSSTARTGMSQTARSDGTHTATGPLSPHAAVAPAIREAVPRGLPVPLAGAAAAAAAIGTAAAALARLPARPAVQPSAVFGLRPVSPLARVAPGSLVPASAQRRPSRRSSARNLARISEAGSTFPPPKESVTTTNGSTGTAAQQPQQPQSRAQDVDALTQPADHLASKRARAGEISSPALAAESQPAVSQPAEDGAATERADIAGAPLPPLAEGSASQENTPKTAQHLNSIQQQKSASSSAALPCETGSSAATAMVWNEGDVEDDPEFWAKLEADSARATGGSSATAGSQPAGGDAQAMSDSARSSSGFRPGSGAALQPNAKSGSAGSVLIRDSGSGAAVPAWLQESARDVGSIEGWQALAAQIMGEVSNGSSSASGSGAANPFGGSGGSDGTALQAAAPVVPLKDVEARPGAYIYIQYQICEELGEGAFGKAFKAIRHRDGQVVVMKTMTRTNLTAKDKQEAKNEVKVLAAMDHPNIVQYFECYLTSNEGMTIVMEFCDDGDLDGVIKRQAGSLMAEQDLMRAFVQILLALQYVHSKGIVHRDIKTNNIFRCAPDVLKLGDFGIAKQLLEAGAQAHTMVGTPYYMSPELLQGKAYDAKADIWSAGCILHEMAGLEKTFEAPSLATMYSRIMEGSYKPIPDSYSPQLHALVAAMLQKEPRNRPTAAAILAMPYVRQHVQEYSAHARQYAQRRRASIRRCLAAHLDKEEAAEWDAVMACEPAAAVDDSAAAEAAAALAASAAAPATAAGLRLSVGHVNPFGTPSAALMATLSGAGPSGLHSYASKSTSGSTGFWGSSGATTGFSRTGGSPGGGSTAKMKTTKEIYLERWRRQQAELDAMRTESQQSQELQASAAEDMAKLRDFQASLRTQLGLPSPEEPMSSAPSRQGGTADGWTAGVDEAAQAAPHAEVGGTSALQSADVGRSPAQHEAPSQSMPTDAASATAAAAAAAAAGQRSTSPFSRSTSSNVHIDRPPRTSRFSVSQAMGGL